MIFKYNLSGDDYDCKFTFSELSRTRLASQNSTVNPCSRSFPIIESFIEHFFNAMIFSNL